ncbi:ankyrin [Rickettsia endosymbiont of Proechinophthirus fluctus]|nr:ankyrin [Rickettsia endosymbiont of Proechinophthirus fluctus]
MKVNKELSASYLQEQNNNPKSIIITMNNFMKLFPFAIAGVYTTGNSIGF